MAINEVSTGANNTKNGEMHEVIVYVKKSRGGAYEAMRYAEKLNKKVINLAEFYCE